MKPKTEYKPIEATVGAGPYGLIALSIDGTTLYIGDNGLYDEDGKKVYLRQVRQDIVDRQCDPVWAPAP